MNYKTVNIKDGQESSHPFRDSNAVCYCSWPRWQHNNYGGSISKRTPSKSSHTFDDKPGCSKRFDLSPRLSTKLFLEYRVMCSGNCQIDIFVSGMRS